MTIKVGVGKIHAKKTFLNSLSGCLVREKLAHKAVHDVL